MQYPGLQGGGALGDASTWGTPARPMAASAHGGTYSHVAVAGGARGGDRGAAAAKRAAAADTAHGRAGGIDRRATGRLQPRRSMAYEIADETPLQKLARSHDHPRAIWAL